MTPVPPTFDQIIQTKLYRPRLSPDLLRRERLCEALDGTSNALLTLVSAPAGYGKSVLVSQWIERRDGAAAWLSLDESESDLRSFVSYLVAAADTAAPGACAATRELLDGPSLPPVPVVAGHLINDLDALPSPCAIVLDDYHRIDPQSPVHELMTRLLTHPPRHVHLVLITRQDPPLALAGLRADGRFREVRLRDLRFTDTETADFLAEAAQLAVGGQALRNLQSEVEGWAVGLRLVALALRHTADPDSFLSDMKGGLPRAQEYLMQEVLAALTPEVRECLLASSILDRFCADVLAAICGPAPPAAGADRVGAEFVEELRRSNLFTISLDAQSRWYRYHHLFRDLLAAELRRMHGPDHIATLHASASGWFEDQDLIEEALKHSVAADDIERAARLVERNRHAAIDDDRWYVLERWLSLLPDETVQQRPELLLARGWTFLHHSRFETVPPLLERVVSLLDDDPVHDPLRGEVALFQGYMLFFLGEGQSSLTFIEKALEQIPVTCYEARAQSEVIHALASQMVGRKDEALQYMADLIDRYDSPANLRKTRLVVTEVFIHMMAGDLDAAERANRRLRQIAEGDRYAYAVAWCDYLQGLVHMRRGDLTAAADFLERSVAQRFIHFKRAAVDSIMALMVTHHALGEIDKAHDTLQLLRDYVTALNDPTYLTFAELAEIRLAILDGQRESVGHWLGAAALPNPEAMLWWAEVPAMTRCRALICAGSPASLEEAESRLRECVDQNETRHNILQTIEALALLAVALERRGRGEDAAESFGRAVALARPGGIVFPFLEAGPTLAGPLSRLPADSGDTGAAKFVARLGALVGDGATGTAVSAPEEAPETRRTTAPGVLDDLTGRELDVLELLARRLQDKEIADRLAISHHTVKHHLKQIYEKLDVHGRRQAVRRAHAIGLLGTDASD